MDRRVTKTKAAIRDAYFTLLNEHPEGHISIAQIARVADIDRKTFYLHYDSIEAIIHEFLYEQVEAAVDILLSNGYFNNPLQTNLMYEALQHSMVQNTALMKKILNSSYAQIFWDEIVNIMENTTVEIYGDLCSCPEQEFRAAMRFVAHGCIAVYKDWLNQNLSIKLKDLMNISHELVHNGIDKFVTLHDEPVIPENRITKPDQARSERHTSPDR
ncbi:MAG: TetR/AcrR family transcriptional regulator [Lachnospiraceae bacterium]|nr:TetR/AcrR family transcriptional regulator [Lachnospiraceae bacterium]